MPSMNIRQLRDTLWLKACLGAGRIVELGEREGAIAGIVPEGTPAAAAGRSDFAAIHKEILKDRFRPRADIVFGRTRALLGPAEQ